MKNDQSILAKYNIVENEKPNKFWHIIRLTIGKIWELPQILLGHLIKLTYLVPGVTKKKFTYNGINYRIGSKYFTFIGGSFGTDVFLNESFLQNHIVETYFKDAVMHEYGHTKQSLYLGPLYLIAVGIISMTRSIFVRDYYKYYAQYPENWADKLGHVGPR